MNPDTGKLTTPAPAEIARVEAHVLRWPVGGVGAHVVRNDARPAGGARSRRGRRRRVSAGARRGATSRRAAPSTARALIETVLAPLVVGRAFRSARWIAFRELSEKQSPCSRSSRASTGPLPQAIAGDDIALHDLAARRAGVSALAPSLRATPPPIATRAAVLPVYASGINAERRGSRRSAAQEATSRSS